MMRQISLSIKVYDVFYKAKESIDREFEDSQKWITDILENPSREKKNKCEICPSNKKLEVHHIRGRKHGNECITACQECHKALTDKQRLWDKSWSDTDSPYKDSFLILGLIDISELKWEKTGQEIYRKIADNLTEGFQYE